MAMTRKQKRLATIGALGVVLGLAATLVFVALRDQIVFFYSPSEIAEKGVVPGEAIRLGGLVLEGSWQQEGERSVFVVHDGETRMTANFTGILPDLFREGQGVVAEGRMRAGTFEAATVLAKHDENYMPREVQAALDRGGYAASPAAD